MPFRHLRNPLLLLCQSDLDSSWFDGVETLDGTKIPKKRGERPRTDGAACLAYIMTLLRQVSSDRQKGGTASGTDGDAGHGLFTAPSPPEMEDMAPPREPQGTL